MGLRTFEPAKKEKQRPRQQNRNTKGIRAEPGRTWQGKERKKARVLASTLQKKRCKAASEVVPGPSFPFCDFDIFLIY